MTIQVAKRDGLIQANGKASDVYALLGLLIEARVVRVCVTVLDGKASVTWAM